MYVPYKLCFFAPFYGAVFYNITFLIRTLPTVTEGLRDLLILHRKARHYFPRNICSYYGGYNFYAAFFLNYNFIKSLIIISCFSLLVHFTVTLRKCLSFHFGFISVK